MILQYQKTLSVKGIQVYPDFDSPNQFWYIPTQIKLAERNNKKIFSYLWYIADANDSFGDGFLNFEVNTAIDDPTLEGIRTEINKQWGVPKKSILLSPIAYSSGTASFVALKPLGNAPEDTERVWSAGTPSLIGDNTAVCSVEFSSKGKLAAAMAAAIEQEQNSVLATYILKYKAMTPAITFKVKGEFSAFLEDFKVSAGLPLPLEGVILNLGFQSEFEASLQKTNIKIELVDYGGADQSQGLEWAKKMLYDYILKNFFEYRLGPSEKWNPLSEKPEISKSISSSNDLEKGGEEVGGAAAKALAASVPVVSINLNVSNYTGYQKNQLDFMYSESRAREFTIAPQSAILEELKNPTQYVSKINRNDFPFGQPFTVQVGGPSKTSDLFTHRKLNTARVDAWYPAGGAAHQEITFKQGTDIGQDPLKYSYNNAGSTNLGYNVSFLFEPSNEWFSDENQYQIKDAQTETNTISAFPGDILNFIDIELQVAKGFVWGDTRRVDVSIQCEGLTKEIVRSFFPGKDATQNVQIRTDKRIHPNPKCTYSYKLLGGQNQIIFDTKTAPVDNQIIIVGDQFAEHVPLTFYNRLKSDFSMALISVHYEGKDGYTWDSDPIEFESDQATKKETITLPTVSPFPDKSKLLFSYSVRTVDNEGKQNTFKVSGANPLQSPFIITGVASK